MLSVSGTRTSARPDRGRFTGFRLASIALATIAVLLPRSADSAPQPTSVQAWHRHGQTFVTWAELPDLFPPGVTFARHADVVTRHSHVLYRIYRHEAPITANTLAMAKVVGEVPVGSGYNTFLYGMEGRKSEEALKRFVIDDTGGSSRGRPLPPGVALHVHTVPPTHAGQSYYAVTAVDRGTENRQITDANAPPTPVSERGETNWRPVLQNDPAQDRFSHYSSAGAMHLFTRWEAEPLHSRNSVPANYMVVVFPEARAPYKVNLSLHCWGAALASCVPWVYYPDGLFVTSTDFPPQTWWTGWNADYFAAGGCGRGHCKGVNKHYTMKRLLSFLAWMKTHWPIDDNRIMCSGSSMGGSGAKMFCLRHGDTFNYVNSWVGIGNPSGSPAFANEYANLFGPESQRLLSESGLPTWDDLNMARWLRANPRQETPFISYANGKNDAAIGWAHAVDFYRALRDTKRAFAFRWGQGGHGERAIDMGIDGTGDNHAKDRIDFQRHKAVPAFANCSLDQNPGSGDPRDGDPEGAINAYQRWDPSSIQDQPTRFAIDLWLASGARANGTMDVTLRNVQSFRSRPDLGFAWKLLEGARAVQAGTGTTDSLGLVSVPGITLRPGVRRKLVVELTDHAARSRARE